MAQVPEIDAEKLEFEELRKKLVAYVKTKEGKKRKARGFSRDELKAVNLTPKQALKLGIPVDIRRKTSYEENISILKSIDLKRLEQLAKKYLKKKKKKVKGKHRKRVFRGLTSAGKKMRGLRKDKLINTHKYKWKKKRKWEK
ncbi:MAG: ribosomal protein L13e [Thermoproteota archaeon]|jgi:large subunit ribosomal protein L13e|nr:ribosomal protein L13e [Thermoproteota archaeon]